MENLLKQFLPMYEASEGNTGGGSSSAGNNKGGQGEGDNTVTEPNNQDNKAIPYERFSNVVSQKNEYKQKYEELIQQQEAAQREAQEKQGQFESLYNELKEKHDPLEGEINQYRETFKTILNNKLEEVPEEYKEFIPNGTEIEQVQWLEKAQAKGLFKKNNAQPFGNTGKNPDDSSQEITQEEFNKMKYTERLSLSQTNPTLYQKLAKK